MTTRLATQDMLSLPAAQAHALYKELFQSTDILKVESHVLHVDFRQ